MRPRVLAVAIFLAGVSPPAFAQRCSAPIGGDPRLSARPAVERIEFLRDALARDAERSMLWREAWTAGLGGAIAGSLAIAGTGASPVRRIDASVSVAKTLVPIVQMAVAPPLVIADARELTEAGSDPCAELARIESLFLRDASDESRVLGWGVHLLPLAANVAIAIALGTFLEDNWTPALLGLGAGLTVNELRMWSQPRGLRGALDRYRAGNLDEPRREASWILAPSLVRGSVRLTLLVPF